MYAVCVLSVCELSVCELSVCVLPVRTDTTNVKLEINVLVMNFTIEVGNIMASVRRWNKLVTSDLGNADGDKFILWFCYFHLCWLVLQRVVTAGQ